MKLSTETNIVFVQTVNMFMSAVRLSNLTWETVGISSLLQPASSGY